VRTRVGNDAVDGAASTGGGGVRRSNRGSPSGPSASAASMRARRSAAGSRDRATSTARSSALSGSPTVTPGATAQRPASGRFGAIRSRTKPSASGVIAAATCVVSPSLSPAVPAGAHRDPACRAARVRPARSPLPATPLGPAPAPAVRPHAGREKLLKQLMRELHVGVPGPLDRLQQVELLRRTMSGARR
jgi:hypothetical protein